ncbi:hypothetical protein ABE236_25875 [Priestia endophytica]|uniref:hypothetical protein n=1 Tax=Priestia endophytica TaxID=135735 RepID=UPI001CEFA7DA|nr:hypothetical protein [Priestia endophytica]
MLNGCAWVEAHLGKRLKGFRSSSGCHERDIGGDGRADNKAAGQRAFQTAWQMEYYDR